jgi:hypothetical protein
MDCLLYDLNPDIEYEPSNIPTLSLEEIMARMRGSRGPGGGESVSGYFRKIFLDRPELLDSKSNDELIRRWKADHGTSQVPNSVRSNLANLKSQLRKRQRMGLPLSGQPVGKPAEVRMPVAGNHGLDALEEHIDDSLTMARNLDRTGLEEVITLLRRARNKVVWKLGE